MDIAVRYRGSLLFVPIDGDGGMEKVMAKKVKERQKKKKKEKEPEYIMSPVHRPMLNYKVYYMKSLEKVVYALICFGAGAFVGYLFYGGLFKDQYGNSTNLTYLCNLLISVGVGAFGLWFIFPMIKESLLNKRRKLLRQQFSDMLEALSTALNAGRNVNDSFKSLYSDMKMQYGKDAYITTEIAEILRGVENNIPIEDMLLSFGQRSGIYDIENFAKVFYVAFRKGGNLRDIIHSTHQVIKDKTEVELEINAIVSTNRMEQKIMIVLPIFLVGIIKMTSPEFAANFATATGVFSTTFAVVCFVVAYKVGQKILNIKL